jgi:hypothetical protein
MDVLDQIKKRFGGTLNAVLLIAILMVCIRFSGAEWAEEVLGVRLLRALYIIAGAIGFGLLFAAVSVAIAYYGSTSAFRMNRVDEVGVSAFKKGVVIAGIVVFTVGLLLVKDYLGPFQKVIDTLVEKLAEHLPGSR